MTPELTPPLAPDDLLHTLDTAVQSKSADDIEIAVLARAGQYTRFAGDVIHQPQDITEVRYLVRAVVDGHAYRTATTVASHLDTAVRTAAAGARQRAKTVGRSGHTTVSGPQPDGPTGRLWFDDVTAFDAAARVTAARSAIAAAGAVGGEAAGMLGRALTQQAVATSRGLLRATVTGEASGSLTVSVADGTAHWIDVGRSADRIQVADSVAWTVAQAVASQRRQELPPGTYEVVLGAEAVGELLHFLPALGFSGELAAAGLGLTATHRGEQVAAELVQVADDAGADVGLPIGFDVEGVTKRRVVFFEHGRVGDPVTDRAIAASLGTESTGHAHIAREEVPAPAAANIVMTPGESTEAELIAGVERGVYLQRFWYTRLADRVAGTITGVTRDACFLIENGKLTTPLAGMRFTQSVPGCLAGVLAIGRETKSQPVMNVWNGATSAPPVRVAAFRLGAAPIEGGNR
ncbi:MAG TPA: TldD/PmbA family protein [Pseudonocardiaceae bacterium]|nr:TldD/PmbA family protein [Pseudonocardiaceae bacterium]